MNNYNLHLVKTKRFKTIKIRVVFSKPIKKESVMNTIFLTDMMVNTTKRYKTHRDLVKQTQNLYGASIYGRTSRNGKIQSNAITLSVLNDRYTEDGNLDKAVELLSEVIFNPDFNNEDSFNYIYNVNKKSIINIKDQKEKYSLIRAIEEMKEKDLINQVGSLKELDTITPKKLINAYNDIINNSEVDIYVVGDINKVKITNIINKHFEFKNKVSKIVTNPLIEYNKFKDKPKEIIEKDNSNNQSCLIMTFKLNNFTKKELNYVSNIYSIILGYSGDSKLFKNIREKHSLCYYIVSSFSKLDNIMMIRSGINGKNYSKVIELINKELDDMKIGNFSDTDLRKAKAIYRNIMDEVKENDAAIIDMLLGNKLLDSGNISKRKKETAKITKKDIMDMANKICVDTIYLLKGVGDENS